MVDALLCLDTPESRIPRDQELADRYLRVASNLATIMSELDDLEMSDTTRLWAISPIALARR